MSGVANAPIDQSCCGSPRSLWAADGASSPTSGAGILVEGPGCITLLRVLTKQCSDVVCTGLFRCLLMSYSTWRHCAPGLTALIGRNEEKQQAALCGMPTLKAEFIAMSTR